MTNSDTPNTSRSGPPATGAEQTLAYWTEERRRAAQPIQPPDAERIGEPRGEIDLSAPPQTTESAPGPGSAANPGLTLPQVYTTALVAHPDQYPHRTVGKLFFRVGNDDRVASAAVVDEVGILTAAHCVQDPESGQWSTEVAFAPAYDNGANPVYRIWPVGEMFTRTEWLGPPVDVGFDFAFCRIPAMHGINIGAVVGWLGIAINRAEVRYWDDHGYPAQPIPGYPFDGQRMWNCGGDYTQTVGATIRKEGNLTPGASGGPWIVPSDDGSFYANGTYSMWFNNPPTENSTPYFRDVVLQLFHAAFG